jgi:hypothetical protein
MEVNFDKQIDTILHDLAKGDAFAESPPVSHLDADELSAFAENVLPQKARLRAMEHLADCSNCRKILSTFVSLHSEVESETVHEEVKTIAAIPEIPWYRSFFAFPNLSYAMGAMALVLVGTIGIILWQNGQDTQNNVAMNEPVAEKVKGPSGVSSDGEAPASEIYSANSTANTSSNVVAQPAANSASVSNSSIAVSNTTPADAPKTLTTPSVGNSNTTGAGPTLTESKKAESGSAPPIIAKEDVAKGGERKQSENEPEAYATPAPRVQTEDNLAVQRAETTQNRAVQNTIIYPDGESREAKRNAPPAPPAASVPRKSAPREGQVADDKDEAEKNKTVVKPTVYKDVAGKSFRSEKGIWTDTAYKGGSLTYIKRGTDGYKKLDSGLRSTADYLGGTVIIVWKGKNYKIQ